MNYTEKIVNHSNKINELHNIASEAVRKGILSSFTVNDRDHSDMVGKGLYLGLNMTYHAIELEINNIKSMMENGDKEMKEFELKVGGKVFIREDLKVDHSYGSLKFSEAHRIGFFEIDYITKSGNFHLVDGYIKMIYSKEMIDWDKTKELQSKENEVKELTVEMIKELLDKGIEVELECIDVDEYLSERCDYHYSWKESIMNKIVVDSVSDIFGDDCIYFDNKSFFILIEDLKYFRIKEQENEIEKEPSATFDDLIDGAIEWINSLCTEIFTIESEDDLDRIKWHEAKALLNNGETFRLHDAIDYKDIMSDQSMYFLLKGAAITQKKGCK